MNEFPQFDESLLTAYIDNELTDAERALVEDVLSRSAEARSLLDDLRQVRSLVSGLQSIPLPRSFAKGPWNQTNAQSPLEFAFAAQIQPAALETSSVSDESHSSPPIQVTLAARDSSHRSDLQVGLSETNGYRNWRLIASLAASFIVVVTTGVLTLTTDFTGRNIATTKGTNKSQSEHTTSPELLKPSGPSESTVESNSPYFDAPTDPGSFRSMREAAPPTRGAAPAMSPAGEPAQSNTLSMAPGGYGGSGGRGRPGAPSIKSGAMSGAIGGATATLESQQRGFGGGGLGAENGTKSSQLPPPSPTIEGPRGPLSDNEPSRGVVAMNKPTDPSMKLNSANAPSPQTGKTTVKEIVGSQAANSHAENALIDRFFRHAESVWKLESNDGLQSASGALVQAASTGAMEEKDKPDERTQETTNEPPSTSLASTDQTARYFLWQPSGASPQVMFDALGQQQIASPDFDQQLNHTSHYRFRYIPKGNSLSDATELAPTYAADQSTDFAENSDDTRSRKAKSSDDLDASITPDENARGEDKSMDVTASSPKRIDLHHFLNSNFKAFHEQTSQDALTPDTTSVRNLKKDEAGAVPEPEKLSNQVAGGGAGGTTEDMIVASQKSNDNMKLGFQSASPPMIEFVIPRSNWQEASAVLIRIGIPVPNTITANQSALYYMATIPLDDAKREATQTNDSSSTPQQLSFDKSQTNILFLEILSATDNRDNLPIASPNTPAQAEKESESDLVRVVVLLQSKSTVDPTKP